MSLKGGSADKSGNNYEAYWTTNILCNMLMNYPDNSSIYFEKPDEINDGFEFVVQIDSKLQYFQIKKYQKPWTIATLCSDGIIKNFIKKIIANSNASCVFLSSSSSSIQELIERAKKSENVELFYNTMMVTSETIKSDIKLLLKEICKIEIPTMKVEDFEQIEDEKIKNTIRNLAYNFLKNLEFRVKDEISLQEDNETLISALFSNPDFATISDGLFRFSQEKYNEKYTKSQFVNYLIDNKKYTFNNLFLNKLLIGKIKTHTEDFIDLSDSFYAKYKIDREETQKIISLLDYESKDKFIFLTGNAGCGKSFVLKEICKYAVGNKIEVLPINIRSYDQINNGEDLGECIYNEKISPLNVLINLSQGDKALLIIDQLDALSTVSGRNITKWEIINKILNQSKSYPSLKILIACRSFDLERDSRFKAFKNQNTENIKTIQMGNLEKETVDKVLIQLGFDQKNITASASNLFSIPLHLKLLSEIVLETRKINLKYKNKIDLFNEFWNSKRDNVGAQNWTNILKLLVDYLITNKTLIAPDIIFDDFQEDLEKMISINVLCKVDTKISFFHEAFFDYCFARTFASKNSSSLEKFIIESDQSLFIRSNVRQTLEFLRISLFENYLKELNNILNNKDIRIHIKLLVLDLLSNFDQITEKEIEILSKLDKNLIDVLYEKQEYYQLIFLTIHKKGELIRDIKSKDEQKINISYKIILASINRYETEMLEIFNALSDEEIFILISNDKTHLGLSTTKMFFENERLYQLVINGLSENILDPKNYLNYFIYNMDEVKVTISQLFDIFIIVLENEAKNIKKNRYHLPRFDELQEHVIENPKLFLEKTFPCFLDIINQNKIEDTKNPLIYDEIFHYRTYNSLDNFITLFKITIENLAKDSPNDFWEFFEAYCDSKFETIQFLILCGLSELTIDYADQVLSYIIKRPELIDIGYVSDSNYMVKLLIHKFSSDCSDNIFERLLSIFIEFKKDWEYEYLKEIKKNAKYKNMSPIGGEKGEFLSAFDIDRLNKNIPVSKILKELQRKFGNSIDFKEPTGIQGGYVPSPLSRSVTEKMTNEQWTNAIYKYNSESHSLNGGPYQLSQELEEIIKLNPVKFLDFIFTLDSSKTNPYYFGAIMDGLSTLPEHQDKKEEIIKYCFNLKLNNIDLSYGILRLIKSILSDNQLLSDELIIIINWLATEHPSPENQLNDDIDFDAINCTRGRAIELIGDVLKQNITYLNKFELSIESAINDILPVKAACAFLLFGIYNKNREYALDLLKKLVESNIECLKSNYIKDFIQQTLCAENFEFYKNMLTPMSTENGSIKSFIGNLFCNYAIFFDVAIPIAETYIKNDDYSYRLGCARLFSAIRLESDFINSSFVKDNLSLLLQDSNDEVADTASDFFDKSKNISKLLETPELIEEVINTRFFNCSKTTFLYQLKKEKFNLSNLDIIKKIVLKFIDKTKILYAEKKGNYYSDADSLFEVILKLYELKEDKDILDILDSFLILPTYTYKEKINAFERTL